MGRYSGRKCRLASMFGLTMTFFMVEIIVGHVTNSMALIADSFHMLSDVAALVVAFVSVKISPKKWSKNTFGWARAEVLGALINSVFLVALCFSVLVESLKRFYEHEAIHDEVLLLVVGILGLIVNLIGLCLFREHGHAHGGHEHSHQLSVQTRSSHLTRLVATDANENDETFTPPSPSGVPDEKQRKPATQMNMRGVFLHVMADALGSVIVIISALIIWLTDWEYKFYVDPVLSILMVLLILRSTWPLLQESALILLQTVPTHIQVDAIQKKLLSQIDGVIAVHEFHVWQLAGDRIIASAHIRCRNLQDYMKIAEQVKEFFHNEGIHSTTIQPEFIEQYSDEALPATESQDDCVLDCPVTNNDQDCRTATCCGASKQGRESPSPATTPYLCRQRTGTVIGGATAVSMSKEEQEVSQMERGHLLANGACNVTPAVSSESSV